MDHDKFVALVKGHIKIFTIQPTKIIQKEILFGFLRLWTSSIVDVLKNITFRKLDLFPSLGKLMVCLLWWVR
jgi:hypothetical protein